MTSNSPPHFPDTGQTGEGRRDQGDAVFEQASIWLARLREPESDVKAETDRLTAFQSWLGASPLHGQAFAEAERLWGRLEMPVRRMARDNRRTSARRHPFAQRMIAAAACLACLIGGATVWRDDISVRLQSDYHTGVGVQTPLDLADGSHITLNTDSAVSLDISRNRRSVRLLRGEAWFDVAKDPSRPFTVETPGGTVRVTGTGFNVRLTADGNARVSLDHGRVELRTGGQAEGASPVVLMPGQSADLMASGISAPETFDRTTVTAWLRGQFVFYDTPLTQVVSEINRYRPGRIVVTRENLGNLRVSGVFRTDDPDAALSVLTGTLPVTATRLTDFLVLLH